MGEGEMSGGGWRLVCERDQCVEWSEAVALGLLRMAM